ncbi:helix-turn-helix domain-containing protein [Paenibacillus sp. JNUCC31]|uniref:helix-turn-helix transcriptional regulator n=1 Tax=Paenibacillus sp. JNUCC-31 TaxID=2777983 RepID=UPI001785D7F9|nr:helix-turn-helix domain-containing protein [Paenibacillus sp. JNUCC-31]QOS82721.1 helix-turn-helix domain-containing protein [Paenibacillus sp. JNUCC-31]
MPNNNTSLIVSIERFKPNLFHLEQGEGLFKSHSHDYNELTLILDGEGYYSSPEQNVKVGKGDMIMIPPALHHGYVCTDPWQGISVHFYHDQLPVHSRYLFHAQDHQRDRIQTAHLSKDSLRWAEVSLSQLEKEWRSDKKNIDSSQLMRLALETSLCLFQQNHSLDSSYPVHHTTGQEIIQEVLKEIHSAYYTPITVSELASRHFLSASNLRKKFTETVGVSPKQYIINLRLMEAKRLLQQTNKAVEMISSEVGFTSSSRFYDFFVKSVGVTPLEWRMQNN